MNRNYNGNHKTGGDKLDGMVSRNKPVKWLAVAIIAVLVFVCLATTVVQATFAVGDFNSALENGDNSVVENNGIDGDGTIVDNTNGALNSGATTAADSGVQISSLINGNLGVHLKKGDVAQSLLNTAPAHQVLLDSNNLPQYEKSTQAQKVFEITSQASAESQWVAAMNYAIGAASDSPSSFKQTKNFSYGHTTAFKGVKGSYVANQYVVVRLQCDWLATNTLSIKFKGDATCVTDKTNGTTITGIPSFTSKPYNTEQRSHAPTDEDGGIDLNPFSFGAINIPTGAHILLDLNGHTINRQMWNLTNNSNAYVQEWGVPGGNVITVSPVARLEIYDSTATENASSDRVSSTATTKSNRATIYTSNHTGSIIGGWNWEQTNFSANSKSPTGDLRSGRGGLIYTHNCGDLVIHSGTYTGGRTNLGGVFSGGQYSSALIFDGYFLGNYGYNWGGVTHLVGGTATVVVMHGGVMKHNSARMRGGALALNNICLAYVFGGEIVNNGAGIDHNNTLVLTSTGNGLGGGIFIENNSIGVLKNTRVYNNYAARYGGGIFINSGAQIKFLGALKVYSNQAYTVTEVGETRPNSSRSENLYLPTGSVIPIGGALLDNGDVAYIGITLQSATGEFTSGYGEYNKVAPYNYFFSDNKSYGVNASTSSIGVNTECQIGTVSGTPANLYWVIKGYHMSAPATLKTYNMPTTSGNTTSDNITRSNVAASFNYKVFRVTRVEAHTGSATGTTVGSWAIDTSTGKITTSSMTASYKFKTGTSSADANQIAGVGTTGNKGLEYAGSYAFLVSSTARYTNPSYTINILQTGIRFSIDQYLKGTKVTSLRYQGTAISELGSTTTGKTGYKLGYYYSDSSLGTTANDLMNYGGIRTSIKYGANANTATAVSEVKNAGTYHLALSFTAQSTGSLGIDPTANNYTFDGSTSFVIAKQRVKVAAGTATYNGNTQKPVTFTANNTNESTALPTTSDFNVYSNSAGTTALTIKNAQTYSSVYVKMTSSNFEIVNASGTVVSVSPAVKVVVNPVKVEIKWGTSTFTYDGVGHAPTATVTNLKNSSDKVTLTVTGGQASVTNSGLATVTACSNSNYTIEGVSATVLNCAYVINPRPVTITWDKTRFTYNGAIQAPKATISNLVTSGSSKDNVTPVLLGVSSINASGEHYTARVLGLEGDENAVKNYTIAGGTNLSVEYYITACTLDITWGSLSFIYDGTAKLPTATLANLCDIDKDGVRVTVNVSTSSPAVNAKDGYQAIVTLSGTHYTNYALPQLDEPEIASTQYKLFDIKPLPIEVEWDKLTNAYNAQPWSPTPTVANIKGNDVVKATVNKKETNAGRYTVSVASVDNTNYTVTGGKNISADYEITAAKLKDFISWPEEEYVYDYDGKTSWYPIPVIKTQTADNVQLVYEGKSVNAGNYVLRVVGYTAVNQNNYSFDPAVDILEQPYTVRPRLALFDWGTAEERARVYSRSVLEPQNVKITNLATGDENLCGIVFEGGQIAVGKNLPIKIVGLTSTNYTIAIDEDAEDYAEYIANLSNTFDINPKPVNIKWDENRKFTYDGQEHVISATITGVKEGDRGIITGDQCGIVYDENSKKVNQGTYFATILGLTNPNYTIANGDEDGHLSEMFEIERATVTVTWTYTEAFNYNGLAQSVTATANGLFGEDKVEFVYENASAKNVGKYTAKIIGIANEATSNYKIVVDDVAECAWEIKPIDITVEMTSIDRVMALPADGLAKENITGWYSFATSGLVGEDVGKQIASLFKVTTDETALRLILVGSDNQVVNDKITVAGDYTLRYQVLKPTEILIDNDNYNVTVIDRHMTFGVLHVTTDAVAGLTINNRVTIDGEEVVRQYAFMYEETEDDGYDVYTYRRTYQEMNFTHGIDDTEFERIVIGQISAMTSIMDFLQAFSEADRKMIVLKTMDGDVVFNCGQPGDGLTEDDLSNSDMYSVGTGWSIEYGSEVIYLSVLGDMNGDGLADSMDVTDMYDFIMEARDLSEVALEVRLAGYFENGGIIDAFDVTDLYDIIMETREITEFFYEVESVG